MIQKTNYKNVYRSGIWGEITKIFTDIEKYNMPIWSPQNVNDYPGVKAIFLDKSWISDVISKQKVSSLKSNNPIFIATQMGTGKTTFIFKKCLPNLIETKSKMLYLCSRSSLAAQVKEIAINDELNSELWVGKKQVKDLKKIYSPLGFQQLTQFGAIDIMTYQGYISNYNDINHNDYSMVLCDESHFFMSDSTFNSFTNEILHKLCKNFQNARRIYLSATPQECLNAIWDVEYNYSKPTYSFSMEIYCMKSDYSYLVPHFFTSVKDIASLINMCANPNERFMIFVKTKKTGEQLKKMLLENGIQAELFTADIDKENPQYQELISKSKLPVKCLITTKFLDVGINVFDQMRLIVWEDDIVELQQMIGRKRLREVNEKVQVYFYIPSIKEIVKRKNSINKTIADIKESIYAIKKGEYLETLKPPFFIKGNNVSYNMLCLKKLKLEFQHCERLIQYLSEYEDQNDRNLAYAKMLLSEFPGIDYDEAKLLVAEPYKMLVNLFEAFYAKELTKEEFDLLSFEIVKILGDPRVRQRDSAPGINTINEVIEKYGYRVLTSGNPTQYKLVKENKQ